MERLDRVIIGRDAGIVTEVTSSGQVRVRLDNGRTIKIDERLLLPVYPGDDAAAQNKALAGPPRNKAVTEPTRNKAEETE